VQGISWGVFGFAVQVWTFYLLAILCMLNSIVFAIVRAYITKTLGHDHHGNGLGALAVLEQLGAVLAPIIEQAVWDVELKSAVQGLSFWVFGGVALIAVPFILLANFSSTADQPLDNAAGPVGPGVSAPLLQHVSEENAAKPVPP